MTRDDPLGEPRRPHGDRREPEAHDLRSADSPAVSLIRRVPALADHIADARRAVLAFAQAARGEQRGTLRHRHRRLEACTNVVMHAYIDAPAPGPLSVEAYHAHDELVVIVTDEGKGMTPRPTARASASGSP